MVVSSNTTTASRPRAVGLFAGIGGIELGLDEAGFETTLLCEIEPNAQRVLRAGFPGVQLVDDIREIESLPPVDLLAGGFPCQDLSQAGRTAGITGRNSGLVGEVLRLLAGPGPQPRWLLLENVPFMLQLDRGKAMRFLTTALAELGFMWAYRVVDARAFGLPQRRRRVVLVASRTEDPRSVLFAEDAGVPEVISSDGLACGFYWTEGIRGLGWAIDAVPTLKGGSTIGIPSPPAIWMPNDGAIVLPDIRDAERLQGFPVDWTVNDGLGRRSEGARWKLVGNAVSVPVSTWVGRSLRQPGIYSDSSRVALPETGSWPTAAWGRTGEAYAVSISEWPVREDYQHLAEFLDFPTTWLSARASAGFLSRARRGSLRFEAGFLDAVEAHLDRVRDLVIA